jgi:cell division septation protein DedD
MSRKARPRDVSSSPEPPYIDISDDSEELGTTDLTLSILAKAEQRKAEKRERNRARDGAGREVVDLEDSGSAQSAGEAAAPSMGLEPGEVEELEEGELNDAGEPAAELEPETPAVTMTARKRKKKKEKRKKEVCACCFLDT